MNDKMCRICWNTNGWRKPSGAVREGNSFAGRHGFGIEEWLFNYEWCIDGFKYGYLTPVSKYRSKYESEVFSATLYTFAQPKQVHTFAGSKLVLLVAEISNIYIPNGEELSAAFETMKSRGWVDQMREDVGHVASENPDVLDALEEELARPIPYGIINIRFRPNDVEFHDPMPRIDWPKWQNRYHPYDRNDETPIIDAEEPNARDDDPTRSELSRKRAAQQGMTIEPKHVRLQNRLYYTLCNLHGKHSVKYEQDYIDLKVIDQDGATFYEIKTDTSAKRCIRNALGQLLEYSSYPTERRAKKLVVIGDAPATQDDKNYLEYLREQHSLPVHYAQFNWEAGNIGQEE